MTGGGWGPCGSGRGRGTGFGRGQGRRNRRWAPEWSGWRRERTGANSPPETERRELQRDEAALEHELQLIRARMSELEQAE
jgi:hypothetical protein